MAVNLIDQFGRARAREILESSFAQFQADRAVVGLARQVREQEESLAGYAKAMTCDRGDFTEYSGIRRELSDLERLDRKDATASRATREARQKRDREPPHDGCCGIPVISAPIAKHHARWAERYWKLKRTRRQGAPRDRQSHRHGRAHLRPCRRRARRARLRRRHRRGRDRADAGGPHDAAHLRRARPAGRRVPADAESGANWMPRPSRPSRAAWSTNPGATTPGRASGGCRAGRSAPLCLRPRTSGSVWTTSSRSIICPAPRPCPPGSRRRCTHGRAECRWSAC